MYPVAVLIFLAPVRHLPLGLELEGQSLLEVDSPHGLILGDPGGPDLTVDQGEGDGSGQEFTMLSRDLDQIFYFYFLLTSNKNVMLFFSLCHFVL